MTAEKKELNCEMCRNAKAKWIRTSDGDEKEKFLCNSCRSDTFLESIQDLFLEYELIE